MKPFLRFLLPTAAALLACATTEAGVFKRITIDGSFSDWAGIPPVAVDEVDSTGTWDYREIYLANDEQYLYVRARLAVPADLGAAHVQVVIDADADPATGHPWLGVGSELLIEDGAPWQQKGGGFNEGAGSGLDWQLAPSGVITQFEARISRGVRDAGNQPVFSQDAFAVALHALNQSWASVDIAPGGAGIPYEFAPKPATATGTRSLLTLAGTTWRYNDSGVDPGPDWLEAGYDDTQAGWSGGPAMLGYGVASGVYPVALRSTMAGGRTAYYLRGSFQWDFDATGVALVVSNYLSDGAVFRLNGAEVRRVRLPEGAITASTPATGGPATPGAAEVFALPVATLLTGANVLQVELHQATGSPSELAFGLSLTATDSLPPTLENPALPADRTVVEGEATTFDAGRVQGTEPFTYQWLKDGQPVPGATGATYTIPAVLVVHAGGYQVEISNSTGARIVSRTAVLTTTAVPVSLVDGAEPVDRSQTEGLPTSFRVLVAGSPILSYQWFKDGTPIEGATAPAYSLEAVSAADAGLYTVEVVNRLNTVTSRAARLTVTADTQAPRLASLAGGGTRVTAVFDEPLDPASAGAAANYTLDGGAKVLAAVPDAADARQVRLTTTALVLGRPYTLTVSGVKDRFGNASHAGGAFRSSIVIDGEFDDWTGVPEGLSESQDTAEGIEFKTLSVVNDDDFIYVRMTFHAPVGPLGEGHYFHVFSDTDNDPATGFATGGIGSEMMVENGGGYQQKNGAFNEGVVNGANMALAPARAGTDFEWRISRKSVFDTDGQPVYTGATVGFRFELISGQWALVDSVPQGGGGVTLTLAELPPMPPGALAARRVNAGVEISWTGAGVLESRDALGAGTWSVVPNAASPFVTSPAGAGRFYRVRQ